MNHYISIGNSDDRLTQKSWYDFITLIREVLHSWEKDNYIKIHGEWFSAPDVEWQNANWCVEVFNDSHVPVFKNKIVQVAGWFNQDSVAWASAEVEFLKTRSE